MLKEGIHVRTTPLLPLGVEVTGLRLVDVLDDEAATVDLVQGLRALLAEHGVALMREQWIDDERFTMFLRAFGDLAFTEGETPVEGHPDLNLVSNVGRATPPRSVFHVDSSYLADPPAYTALRAVVVPEQGGQTLFTDQYAAYDTLDEDLKSLLDGRGVRHVATGVPAAGTQQREAWHPALRAHPLSGRTSLYLSTPERCVEVEGLSPKTGRDLIGLLYEHSTAEHNILRHAWAPGDVVMWDNACVLHKADHSGVVGDRVMHRGMVADHGPGGVAS